MVSFILRWMVSASALLRLVMYGSSCVFLRMMIVLHIVRMMVNGTLPVLVVQADAEVNAGPLDSLHDLQEGMTKMSDTFQDTLQDFYLDNVNIIETSTIAGQISPILSKFVLSRAQLEAIWKCMTEVIHVVDIAFLVLFGFALVPTVEVPYTQFFMNNPKQHRYQSQQTQQTDPEFRSTKVYHVVNTISQIARLAMVVYAFDLIKIFLMGAGFHIPRGDRLTHAFSYILYTLWATNRLSLFKEYLLCNITKETEGRIHVVNRLGDAILGLGAMFLILDILNFEMGLAMKGAVAFGSVGTLVFSLAAKDIVSNFLNGIILSASDRIYEGDSIILHKSGFKGNIHKLGWLETVLRGSDEVFVTIPNSDLLSQRVCNLSRIHQSQVTQTLRFSYNDTDKLPQLIQDIRNEIRATCPSVITDGSRPFRVYWTSYQGDHLEVMVDAHFRIKPVGDAYYENRQRVLQAIDRAVRKNNMDFQITM